MTDKKYKYWLAVVDGQLVQFADLPHMMATAMHPEGGMDYASARINLDSELKQAVQDGALRVRNPAGLGFHTFPHGNALQRAVLIPGIDLEPFLNARGIELRVTPHGNGPDYWTLENAAAALQEQEGWHDGTRAEFQDQMQEAAASGALVILDPRTCLPPLRTESVRTYWEYVTPDSVNTWLLTLKAPYRWSPAPPLGTVPQKSPRDFEPWKLLIPFFEPIEGLYMYQQAGRQIADAEGWDDSKLEALWDEMATATNSGALPIRSRKTGAVIPPNSPDALSLVTVDDVNEWLKRTGRLYRWKLQSIANQPHANAPFQVAFGAPPTLTSVRADGNPVFDSDGYAQYLKAKSARNAQGRYTVAEAAQVLSEAHDLKPAKFIEHRMLPAIAASLLHVIDPADGGPLRGRKCNVYADEVTPEGIDAWLSAEGFAKHVRWPESAVTPEPPAPMAIAAEQREVPAKAEPTGPRLSMTKAAMIAQHKHEWPTIEGDLKDASGNGLSKAAKAGARDWYEDGAMEWARSKNKLIRPSNAAILNTVMSSLPSRTHRLEG